MQQQHGSGSNGKKQQPMNDIKCERWPMEATNQRWNTTKKINKKNRCTKKEYQSFIQSFNYWMAIKAYTMDTRRATKEVYNIDDCALMKWLKLCAHRMHNLDFIRMLKCFLCLILQKRSRKIIKEKKKKTI